MHKRPATPEEIEEAIELHARCLLAYNQTYGIYTLEQAKEHVREKVEDEGNETCSCGMTFLSFHSWTTCQKTGCPMKSNVTLLEGIFGSD